MLRNTKLRLLVMMAGAIAAFSVVGVAASFTVNDGENIVNAEGETLVVTCSDNVEVEKKDQWRDPAAGSQPGTGGFVVTRVVVKGGAGCAGMYAYVALTGDAGQLIGSASGKLNDGGTVSIQVTALNIRVQDLHDIHVLLSDTDQVNPFVAP